MREQAITDAERVTRVELAACYRLIAHYGMSDLIYNHITACIPGTDHLLINAYGWLYSEITASNLVTIDVRGNTLHEPSTAPLQYHANPAGIVIHTAIHQARPDVKCVIHTHSRAGMAVSATEYGLLPLTQTAMRFHGRLGMHEYDNPIVELEQQAGLVQSLGAHEGLILRNHGLLVVGPSIAEAFNRMYWLEMACRAQVDAMAMNTALHHAKLDHVQATSVMLGPQGRRAFGVLEWPAMLRLARKLDPSFEH